MDITTELDTMRADLEGCVLVAFTDLSSQLVLSSSSASKPAQEEMNALSQAAHLVLDGTYAKSASEGWDGNPSAEAAVLMTGAEARVFLRSPANPAEALVAVCAPDTDLDAAVAQARATLERIVAKV